MKQPDIEIYLKDKTCDLTALTQCLNHLLGVCSPWQPKAKTFQCDIHTLNITATYYPKAIGQWNCLYFNNNQTPWHTDEQCAKAISQYLQIEVRCSKNGWVEDQDSEKEKWLKITTEKTEEIQWITN